MAVPKPQEVAEIRVYGRSITNWESVMVQLRWGEMFNIFDFTTAESLPPSPGFVQIMPGVGNHVQIFLAGNQAIDGYITMRQSAMDARIHTVQLVGKSATTQLAKSSIKNDTNNYDGKSLLQIAQEVAAEVGLWVTTIGDLINKPFEKMSSAKGQPSWDFIEHLCRERAAIASCNEFGQVVLIGNHSESPTGDSFIEGQNIERINIVWNNDTVYQTYEAFAQDTGSDAKWGKASSELKADASGKDNNPSNFVIPQEHATDQADVQIRADAEAQWHNATDLFCYITVQGWLQNDGDIYRPGRGYFVNAPTHLINNKLLKAKSVTLTQDEGGATLTTLELVKPEFLNGHWTGP